MSADRTTGARRWKALTPGVILSPAPDSIIANLDSSVVLEGDDKETMALDLVGGSVYPFRPSKLVSATTPVYGLYNSSK